MLFYYFSETHSHPNVLYSFLNLVFIMFFILLTVLTVNKSLCIHISFNCLWVLMGKNSMPIMNIIWLMFITVQTSCGWRNLYKFTLELLITTFYFADTFWKIYFKPFSINFLTYNKFPSIYGTYKASAADDILPLSLINYCHILSYCLHVQIK